MPLVLAVHSVANPSANVPFAVILLQDAITNKKVPELLKCRQLVPSSGARSTSLWDVPDPAALQQWLEEAINVDVSHEVFEVQEEFAIGLGEVVRARAAERVKEGTKEVAEKTGRALGVAATTVGNQVNEIDHKLRISERASAAGAAIKESAVGRSAVAALGKVGTTVGGATKKVMENEKVHATTSAVGASFKKLGASLSSLTGRRGNNGNSGSSSTEHVPQFVQDDTYAAPPPSQAPYHPPEPAGSMRNPAATPAPPPAEQQQAGAPKFTLDDNDEPNKP